MDLLQTVQADAQSALSASQEQHRLITDATFEGLLRWVQADCETQNSDYEAKLHTILVCYMKLMGEDIVPLWLFKNCQMAKRLPMSVRAIVKKARAEVVEDCLASKQPTKRIRTEF